MLVVGSLAGGCQSPIEDVGGGPCPDGAVCVVGTVRHETFEGGFWAIRGEDQTTYDPVAGLPADYQVEGLRVYLVARVRTDLASFHQAGPLVDILSLRRL